MFKNINKKVVGTLALLVLCGSFLIAQPQKTEASFSTDLTSLIQSLLLQVENLQKQLLAIKTTPEVVPPVAVAVDTCSYHWSRYLNEGDYGTDVQDLQKFLNDYSEKTRVTYLGFGSKGYETPYFGKATGVAVKKFQAIYDITENGFGPITQANAMSVCTSKPEPVDPVPSVTDGPKIESIELATIRKVTVQIVSTLPKSLGTPVVDGSVQFGVIDWGDGSTEKVFDLAVVTTHALTHTYSADGSFVIEYTDNAGSKVSQTQKVLSPAISRVLSYSLADVQSITTTYVDPIKNAIDDEYTLYSVTLTNGQKFEFHANGMAPREWFYKDITASGYVGDIEALLAKVK